MIAQRVGVAALRRGAAKPNVFFTQTLPKVTFTAGLSTTPSRPAATMTKLSAEEGQKILVNQRLQRPISPHLGIYKLEQTWLGHSAWTRITGCTLSAGFYAYMGAYLIAPLLGWHFESASVAAAFSGLPLAVKGGFKLALGFPFAFHFWNGLRHLYFDLGKGFAKQSFIKAEKYLWAASFLSAFALAFAL